MNAFTLGLSLLFTLFSSQPIEEVNTNAYQCQSPRWNSKPTVSQGNFVGTVSIHCSLQTNGGSFSQLEEHLDDTLREKARQIHAGPNRWIFESMAGHSYDVTISLKDRIQLRGVHRMATNRIDRLHQSFHSTQIQGSGSARYLKEARMHLEVRRHNDNQYSVDMSHYLGIRKPFGLPTRLFISRIKREIEQEFRQNKDEVIGDIASNL